VTAVAGLVGRPVRTDLPVRVGLDVGGTKIDAVAVDDDGLVLARTRLPSGFGADEVVANAASAVARVLGAPAPGSSRALVPRSVGVGIPGVVDPVTGRVSHAVNLGFADVAFGDALSRLVGVPVAVENDVNAAALGTWHALGLRGSMAYLNLGTGLAAGIVVDGVLSRGSRGAVGEIGHVPVDPAGVLCTCGQRGCLETVASGTAAARLWPTDVPHPARDLFTAADHGDPAAVAARTVLADGVAAAVRLLVLTVDVETIVVGGGLSALGGPLLEQVRASLDRAGRTSPFVASLDLPSRVVLLPADAPPVAAVGAAMAGAPADPSVVAVR